MKFQDLTKDQQEHLTKLIEDHGATPEGCTHFDMYDSGYSSFMKECNNKWSHWERVHWTLTETLDSYQGSELVLLPEPPYYLPESVALPEVKHKAKPPVQQKAIIQCYLIDTFGCSDREALAHSRLIIQEIT